MMSFRQFLNEEIGAPTWVKSAIVLLGTRISTLENQIANETSSRKRDELIARQIKLASIMTAVGVAANLKDKTLKSGLMARKGRSGR